MSKLSIGLLVVLALCCLCCSAARIAPGYPRGGAVYVAGGVRPIIARPGIYRAPVIYRPPVVVQKVIQPVIVPRPVPILAG